MRIYIRHAEKKYKNGESLIYKHDPEITENSYPHIKLVIDQLIKLYGLPTCIYSSPYLRTKQTANQIVEVIRDSFNLHIKIVDDVSLSEYLGNRKDEKLDVTNETLINNPPHPETFYQLEQRVKQHDLENQKYDNSYNNIWFVTHGIIVNRIAKLYGLNLGRNIPYLSYLSVQQQSSSDCLNIETDLYVRYLSSIQIRYHKNIDDSLPVKTNSFIYNLNPCSPYDNKSGDNSKKHNKPMIKEFRNFNEVNNVVKRNHKLIRKID